MSAYSYSILLRHSLHAQRVLFPGPKIYSLVSVKLRVHPATYAPACVRFCHDFDHQDWIQLPGHGFLRGRRPVRNPECYLLGGLESIKMGNSGLGFGGSHCPKGSHVLGDFLVDKPP